MTTEETLASWNLQLEAVRANMLRGGGGRMPCNMDDRFPAYPAT